MTRIPQPVTHSAGSPSSGPYFLFLIRDNRIVGHSNAAAVKTDPFPPPTGLDFRFSFAFQPIVNAQKGEIISFEALVRGPRGEPSANVFAQVTTENRSSFDQACQVRAIQLASHLNLKKKLNINIFPYAFYNPDRFLRAALEASRLYHFPARRIIFEITEGERIDPTNPVDTIRKYKRYGVHSAIDDFGAGYAGFNLLTECQPNYIKLDRNIIADVHQNRVRQTIVKGLGYICSELAIELMAEGVEKAEEYEWLREAGVNIFQGFYFARPKFEALPEVAVNLYRN